MSRSFRRRPALPDDVVEAIFTCLEEDYRPRPGVDPEVILRQKQPFSYIARTSPFEAPLHEQLVDVLSSASLVSRQWHILAQEFLYKRIWVCFPRDFETLLAVVAEPDELEGLFAPGEGAAAMNSNSRDNSPSGRSPARRSLEAMPNPGLMIRSLSFEKFRTSGLGRTVGEGSQRRYVTTNRVLKLLQGTRPSGPLEGDAPLNPWLPSGRLKAVGFTEYMDSALTIDILLELLLRGGTTTTTIKGLHSERMQLEGSELAQDCIPLRAIDFCGCISRTFVNAVQQLVERFRLDASGEEERRTFFPHLRRLGLFDVGSLSPSLLASFVSSFPSLTYLDLARTRASPALLAALSKMPIQLRALSLMRCTALTGPSIVEFFCNSGVSVTSQLVDLCLGSDESAPVPLDCNELSTLLTKAPCFKSGKLRVLDLSSCPFDDDILMSMPVTSDLITLGLASCRNITIPGVASFLEHKAHTVECLDLTRSCAPLHQPQAGLRRSVGVPHLDPLALHFHLLNHLAPYDIDDLNARSIRLRVIELEERALQGLGAGVGAWKPIYCGRRSFYIDTSVTGMFEHGKRKLRKLEKDSDERLGLLKLTEKSTKTDASVGWRPFKMEVLEGHGLLGREDGLYAYHAFQA